MLVSHRKKFIFVKTSKTAGTSVESFFEPWCMPEGEWEQSHAREETVTEAGIIGRRSADISGAEWHGHMFAEQIREKLGQEMWDAYFKFTVVRNPFDRMISRFFMQVAQLAGKGWNRRVKSWWQFDNRLLPMIRRSDVTRFRNWVRRGGRMRGSEIYRIDGQSEVDFFIRYENLENDIREVCKRLDIEFGQGSLPRFKSGFRNRAIPVRDFYDRSTREHVEREHAWEIECFGYEMPD